MKPYSYDEPSAIRDLYRKLWEPRCCPYQFVRAERLSPIEKVLWAELRSVGVMNMYMQYPILNYFADFANPVMKFTIEADGKGFHQDWKKDEVRQKAIEAEGWTVFRLTGSAIMRYPETIFRHVYPHGFNTDSDIVYEYTGLPWDEKKSFIRHYKEDCGTLFCEWLRYEYQDSQWISRMEVMHG